MQIAELLEVSVGQLLDIDTDKKEQNSLSEELARLNDQLAEKARKEKLALKANRKRGLILLLSFAAMLVALMVRNEIVSIILVGGCLLASVIILYRNLALLTRVTTDDMKIGILRLTTIFNICILAAGIIISVLTASKRDRLHRESRKNACHASYFLRDSVCRNHQPKAPLQQAHRASPAVDSAGRGYMEPCT